MTKSFFFGILIVGGFFSGVISPSRIEAWETACISGRTGTPAVRAVPPAAADNRTKFLRTSFEHRGHPCFAAAGISYAFTYEVNLLRNLPSNTDDNLYPYTYAYFFHNGGSPDTDVADVLLAYQLLMATGVPNNTAMGGFEAGFNTSTWLNGYDKYYQAMHNRIQGYGSFDLKTAQGFADLKQWLYDHGTGAAGGGLANFNVSSGGVETDVIALGAETGKTVITSFGKHYYDHTLTIVGYNDSVKYDLNDNGVLSDDEKGAFIILNSHLVWDNAFAYCPYKLFTIPYSQGGIGRDNMAYYFKAIKDFQPKYTLKATITHTSRSSLKIYAGISADVNAAQPTKVKYFAGAFNYAGGAYPMQGKGLGSTIEIGLDVTDLPDSIGGKAGAFFLCIDSRTGGSGKVNKLSLMDYTQGTPKEIPHASQDIEIQGNIKLGGMAPSASVLQTDAPFAKSGFLVTPSLAKRGTAISLLLPGADLYGARVRLYTMRGQLATRETVCGLHTAGTELATAPLAAGVYKLLVTTPLPNMQRYEATVMVMR